MRQYDIGARCDLCGSRHDITTARVQIPPGSVRINVCLDCRSTATAVEALDAGRPRPMGRPCEDVILAPPNVL